MFTDYMWFLFHLSIYLLFALNEFAQTFHCVIFVCARTDLKTDRCLRLVARHSSCDAINPSAEGQIYKSDLDNKRQSVSKSGQWT